MLKKIKRRYLALAIDSKRNPDSREFMDAIWGSVVRLYGEYGASRSGLALIDYNTEKKVAIIRTANAAVNMVRTSVCAITKINNETAVIHVLKISGTIKALSKKLE